MRIVTKILFDFVKTVLLLDKFRLRQAHQPIKIIC